MASISGSWSLCLPHEQELAAFSHDYLHPPDQFLHRRHEAEPTLRRILESAEHCPKCQRRGAPELPSSLALSSEQGPAAEGGGGIVLRMMCSRNRGGPWRCTYEASLKRKILLLGDLSANKTQLLRPALYDAIADAAGSLLGAKVMTRHEEVSLPQEAVDFHVIFSVFDIFGRRFTRKGLLRSYFRGAKTVVGVCDLEARRSVEELGHWLGVARWSLGPVRVILVARARDAPDPLPISEARLQELVAAYDAPLILVRRGDMRAIEHLFHVLGEQTVHEVFGTRWRISPYR